MEVNQKLPRNQTVATTSTTEMEMEEVMQGLTETEITGESNAKAHKLPIILTTDKHWKVFHAWTVKNNLDSLFTVTRDAGYTSAQMKNKITGNCKNTCRKNISTIDGKISLKMVIRGLPISFELNDVQDDLTSQSWRSSLCPR